MTTQEINELCAKGLGWIPSEEFKPNTGWIRDGYFTTSLPDYCGDISAAWEIVEKERISIIPITNGKWLALKIQAASEGCDEWYFHRNCFDDEFADQVDDIAPMAICLAFLKLDSKKDKACKK